ncbi:SCO family protein [Pelistega ratti]|uniref:SCO family protein n=1 Tax=Pelistega ratti TaxID=2652177 RepID=UPI00135A07DB
MLKSLLSIAVLCTSTVLLTHTPAMAQETKPTVVYNIGGNLPDLEFTLQGVDKPVSASDLKGKVVMVFFGYASCPDICPTTMAELSAFRDELSDAEKDKLQIVFISVDPHRDTPAVLQAYVDAFHNGAIGLTGTDKQIAEIAKRYRVAYQIEKPKPGDDPLNYEVMHAQGVYIFDTQGKAKLLASNADNTELIKEKTRPLLK